MRNDRMQQWLNARCSKLLEDLNNTPFTDDVDEIKLNLIRAAMREASLEMFHRAAENSRKRIEQINKQSFADAIETVENNIAEEVMADSEINDVMAETAALLAQADTEPEIIEPETPEPQSSPTSQGGMNSAFENVSNVSDASNEPEKSVTAEEKPKPKIQISSSVIRRSD